MNHALFGDPDDNKTDQLLHIAKPPFLFIGDGPVFHAFRHAYPKATFFDTTKHSFDPLKDIDYLQACDFVSALMEAFPAGTATLTKEGVPDALLDALLDAPKALHALLPAKSKDPSYISAQRMIRRILRSPVLARVLTNAPNFAFTWGNRSQPILANIDRAQLGDFDAFFLATQLIRKYQGQLIVQDGGFYLRDLHMSLIRQNRLVAGVTFLAELSDKLQQAMLLIKDKTIYRTTPEDAARLVIYTKHTEPKNLSDQRGNDYLSSQP